MNEVRDTHISLRMDENTTWKPRAYVRCFIKMDTVEVRRVPLWSELSWLSVREYC
jgi:hypothetical protein